MTQVPIEFNCIATSDGYFTPDGMPLNTSTYTKWVKSIDDLCQDEKAQVLIQLSLLQLRVKKLELFGTERNEHKQEFKNIFLSVVYKVSELMHVTIEQMRSRSKTREVAFARMVAMVLLRNKLQLSFKTIGDWFNRDHTTVMSAVNTIKDLVDVDENIRNQLDKLMNYDYVVVDHAPQPTSLQIS